MDVGTTSIDGVRDREVGGEPRRARRRRPGAAPAVTPAADAAEDAAPVHEPGVGERIDVVA